MLSHDCGVTAYEPGDLGVHSNAQVALFRAFPGPRGRLHPSELVAAPVLNRHHRTPQPSGQLAARGAPPGLPSLGQQPVFFLRPEIRVTCFLNPPSRRAGRRGSGLPPTGARRVRHASFAACSRLPGSVLLQGNVSPLRMSILSPCCFGYSSSNRSEDQADSSSNKRINVRAPRLAFRTWVARPPKAPFPLWLDSSYPWRCKRPMRAAPIRLNSSVDKAPSFRSRRGRETGCTCCK